jgi:RimJ/RimL family protein N-acetyltransferase
MLETTSLVQSTLSKGLDMLRLPSRERPAAGMERARPVQGPYHALMSDLESVSFVPIRALHERHRARIAAHLRALDEHDRYLRFGYVTSDEQIDSYVAKLDFKRDEIFGIFNRKLTLIAMAHLAYSSDPDNPNCAEFGVSVAKDARGKRLGTRLFERAITSARAEGVDMLFIHALAENTAMIKIAQRAGALIENFGGETEAFVQLPPANLETRVEDVMEDGIGAVDYRLKLRAKQFSEFLSIARREWRDMRQTLLASETPDETSPSQDDRAPSSPEKPL